MIEVTVLDWEDCWLFDASRLETWSSGVERA